MQDRTRLKAKARHLPNMASNDPYIRRINLVRIAHVFYKYKDIATAKAFLDDFGFQELVTRGSNTYYRGTGTEPFVCCATAGSEDAFGGAAFVVESRGDLEYAAKTIPGATPVHEMQEEPGGGLRVTFEDPVDGFPFHLVYGQVPVEPSDEGLLQRRFNFVSLGTKLASRKPALGGSVLSINPADCQDARSE